MIFYIFLIMFVSNISFAETQSVSPIVEKYRQKNKIKIQKNLPYKNIENDIGKTSDELYYGEHKHKNTNTQIDNPYFMTMSNSRNSPANIPEQEISYRVINNIINKEENQEQNIRQNSTKNVPQNQSNNADTQSTNNIWSKMNINFIKNLIPSSKLFHHMHISDKEVLERPTTLYTGFLGSLMLFGNTQISGDEERPNPVSTAQNTSNNQWISYTTYSTTKTYLPSVELGIFCGSHFNSWIRYQLDLTWTYMYGTNGTISTLSGSPGAHFTLPSSFASGNLFASTMNIFFDPYQNLKIWPTIGVGGGAGFFVFNNYISNAVMWPILNLYLGANYMLDDKRTVISLGLKLQYIYTGNAGNNNPITDTTGTYKNYRPTNIDESVFFGLWIMKLELGIRFY